jgi:hypothetical protein
LLISYNGGMDKKNNNNSWEDSEQSHPCINQLEKWVKQPLFSRILEDAAHGDEDSIEIVDQVTGKLNSLIFHLHNDSGELRLQYELDAINSFLEEIDPHE